MTGERRRRFTVTEQHLKLLRRMYVGWEDCEFGAPAIDCKRPYGNSDVLSDMREILGRLPRLEDDWSEGEDAEELRRLHREMQTVLQIGVRTGAFFLGTYEVGEYGVDWRRVE